MRLLTILQLLLLRPPPDPFSSGQRDCFGRRLPASPIQNSPVAAQLHVESSSNSRPGPLGPCVTSDSSSPPHVNLPWPPPPASRAAFWLMSRSSSFLPQGLCTCCPSCLCTQPSSPCLLLSAQISALQKERLSNSPWLSAVLSQHPDTFCSSIALTVS